MFALGLKLLGFGKWLKEAATGLLRLAGQYPWQAALIASLCLSGWLWWGWNKEQAAHTETGRKWEAAANAWEAASKAHKAKAIAQVKATEAKSAQIAKEADNAHQIALSDARSAAERYANRMRLDKVCRGNTTTPAERDDPGIPPQVPSDPGLVAIKEPDLQALVEWATVGIQAHNHAVDKIEAGLAKRELPSPAFGN